MGKQNNPLKKYPYNIETIRASNAPTIDKMTLWLKHQKPSTLPKDATGAPIGHGKVIHLGPWKN